MNTYTPDQLIKLNSEQIDMLQKSNDSSALSYIAEQESNLTCLTPAQLARLKEYYTDTMEKYRMLYEAIVSGFSTSHKPGFPEDIFNINLKDGSIETDKNKRKICYSTEILAPCTNAMLHYINSECNDVYVIIPPIKSVERTVEKIISECYREYDEKVSDIWAKFENYQGPDHVLCPTAEKLEQQRSGRLVQNALVEIIKSEPLPKDIYRLSITSKYQGDLEELIKTLEKKFPSYIQFERGERNLYKKHLSENTRNYFDIKKTAQIKLPGKNRSFFIEFQFKQTNMFFAHIRSHSAYEEYRILEAKYITAKESAKAKKTTALPEVKAKLAALKKQSEDKRNMCLKIHRNAVHQSNMYLMRKVLWLDENARGLHREPEHPDGKYDLSIQTLQKNYIVEEYVPFDGATAFTTSTGEYLNKCYYLKLIGILPESFDELSKNAKIHINKAWSNLTEADVKDFNSITNMAVKYQDTIRAIQKEKQFLDNASLLNILAENTGR